jgi:hypothetical protein
MLSDTCAMTLAQKSDRILAKTRGLSGATPNATQLIEELRWALEENRKENATLTAERDEARRIACTYVSGTYTKDVVSIDRTAAMAEAARRGWDCYKEAK